MSVLGDDEAPPPWVWDHHPDDVLRQRWHDLACWVQWLEAAYAPWVRLPPCWPAHQGLRAELTVFWYWHGWLQTFERDPVAVLRWHHMLRVAARAWSRIAGCDHRRHWDMDTAPEGPR